MQARQSPLHRLALAIDQLSKTVGHARTRLPGVLYG